MKKHLRGILSLSFIVLGIAMVVVNFACQPSLRLQTILACAYTALGFGTYGALSHERMSRRGIIIFVLVGVLLTGFDWLLSVMFVVFYFGKMLLAADEEEAKGDKADIELPPGSGFLLTSTDNVFYQLFRGWDRLFLVYLGTRFYTPDANLALRTEDDYQARDMDRAIPFNKIRAIRIEHDGTLHIRGRKGGRFFAQSPETADEIAKYLEGLPVAVKRPPAPRSPRSGARTLKNILFALSLSSGLCAAAWMYLDAPATVLATMNFAIIAISFISFCLYYDTANSDKADQLAQSATVGLLFPFFPLIFYFFRGYNFVSPAEFATPVAILVASAFLLFLIINARRQPWGTAIALFLLAVPYSALFVGNYNVLWDDGARAHEQTAIVWEKDWPFNGDRSDPYELTVGTPSDEEGSIARMISREIGEFSVSKELFDAVEVGDEILVVTRTGLFGIDYTTVEIPKQ